MPTNVLLLILLVGAAIGCKQESTSRTFSAPERAMEMEDRNPTDNKPESAYLLPRKRMVEQQLSQRDIRDERVLSAMSQVERHRFVPDELVAEAYDDNPLPIGYGQTISQPYIVALMTQLVRPKSTDRVLEIGTGCGYQSAVLAELVKEVYSIEIVEPLAVQARQRLADLDYRNVHVRAGDGFQGWKEHAPFDVILVAAAPAEIPPPLLDQLAIGGRLIIPVGVGAQQLKLVEKLPNGQFRESIVADVRFVPMTGEAEK
jgi:protein-L-isoaspartate(D-aspartate) O-methyltransferase